jgi:hypothetical protein
MRLNPTLGPIELVAILVVSTGLILWPAWRICAKTGYPGALALLLFCPVLNLLLLYFLALVEWPALRAEREKSTTGIYPDSLKLSDFK